MAIAEHITRRALFRGAGQFAAIATVAAVPGAVVVAAASTPVENPRLLRAWIVFSGRLARYQRASQERQAALALYDREAPALPDDLILKLGKGPGGVGGDPSPFNWCCEPEVDVEGRRVQSRDGRRDRLILKANKLRAEVAGTFAGSRTKLAKDIRRRLKIAEEYEAGSARARRIAGFRQLGVVWRDRDPDVSERHEDAAWDLHRAAQLVHSCEARTFDGLALKAKVMTTCEAIADWPTGMSAAACFGLGLALNVERVLGEVRADARSAA